MLAVTPENRAPKHGAITRSVRGSGLRVTRSRVSFTRLRQSGEMTSNGASEQIQTVAAFQQTDDPPRSMFFSEAPSLFSHFGKIGVFQHEAAQRIAASGIETGRDDDQIRRKSALDFVHPGSKGFTVLARGGPLGQGNIER